MLNIESNNQNGRRRRRSHKSRQEKIGTFQNRTEEQEDVGFSVRMRGISPKKIRVGVGVGVEKERERERGGGEERIKK